MQNLLKLNMAYIYCITNEINQKKYVGKTATSIEKRFKEHCSDCWKERCEKRPLYDAMQKYGTNKFKIELLEEVIDLNLLSDIEMIWIDKLDTYRKGYNATIGGDGKFLYNHDEIITLYKEGGTMQSVADKIGCCSDTVSIVLKANDIPKNKHYTGNCNLPKKVKQFTKDKEYLRTFDSTVLAAEWLFENKYVATLCSGVRGKVSNVANGKQKTAYKFIWEWE